jgi:predicted MFS family arabinose efflux permease
MAGLFGSCWLLRKRLPHNKKAGASIDLMALKDKNYALTTLAVWLVEFAVFIPYTYISSYAIYQGIKPEHAFRLSALLNVGAIPGRALPGYVADRFGYFNVMCITSFTCATFIFALWLTSGASEAAITAFAVIFGFWSGLDPCLHWSSLQYRRLRQEERYDILYLQSRGTHRDSYCRCNYKR